MNNKKRILVSIFTVFLLIFSSSMASAKVMWGKTELKKGQIGKVTILTNVNATKINENTLTQDKRLKKGEEYRIYSYRVVTGIGYYGLGGGLFVQKSDFVKYETPSKAKLALLEQEGSIKDNGLDSNAPTSFKNCTELRKYYPNGVASDHPAYAPKHDRDNDGWACER
ncbi:excalibur calcium-binding domain-containing protein [Cytobacillus praedii]|uniref:excalibur calcium-binding domain-containing protein n=1 Tax=Cytobacillus praedii TaxID=1742358 RepID=UPI002E2325B6|nr:excalibur calcium-binding domain-containing protein [Cytobacillus praedii]